MSIFMKATLKVEAYQANDVVDVLVNKMAPMFEEYGWKMHGCFVERFGPVKPAVIVDLWEMEDMAHVERVMKGDAYRADPRYLEAAGVLKQAVLEESLQFLEKRGGLMPSFYD
ncbi:hypothetical protein DHB74_09825 [Pseudomonas sp. G11-1]|nr:hypothetical protein [Pseudomonas sp. G11-1]MCO5789874.1 hypothetical protein [Pseudomonas sp. G11-2]